MNGRKHIIPTTVTGIWARYGVAGAAVSAATGVMVLLETLGVHRPRFPFYLAVAATAWIMGSGPAAGAVVLSALGVEFFMVPPVYSLRLFSNCLPSFLAFLGSAALVAVMARWAAGQWRFSTVAGADAPTAAGSGSDASVPRGGALIGQLNGSPDLPAEPLLFPDRLIRGSLRGSPEDFFVLEIEGPTMFPNLESGDWVLLDRRRTIPLPPGMFAVDEGIGAVIKWIEVAPHSNPVRYRVCSGNSWSDPYEIAADDVRIIGRAAWVGRRI